MPKISEYMRSIFSEIAKAAGADECLEELKTSEIAEDVKDEQYKKLTSLRCKDLDAIELPSASFFCRFSFNEDTYLCVQTEELREVEVKQLKEALGFFDAEANDMDESTFLFLAHKYKKFYNIKSEILSKESAVDKIEIVYENDYKGHEIYDVMNWFERVSIFLIPQDSKIQNCNKWYLAAYLSVSCSAFRAKSFPPQLAAKLKKLLEYDNINPENIYYASTSLHLRQCFMEVYRCIEALYYLPWIILLRDKITLTKEGKELSNILRESIGWRQKEKDSIEQLFELLPENILKVQKIKKIKVFADINDQATATSAIARRIYKIRNVLVHQQDYENSTPLNITSDCWPAVIEYILDITLELYDTHKSDCKFTYSSDTLKA